jgi:hypothetical protein
MTLHLRLSSVLLATLLLASALHAAEESKVKLSPEGLTLEQISSLAIDGDAYFQAALSTILRVGDLNTKMDYASALEWAKLSAEAGDPLGKYALAALYDAGLGVKLDKEMAEKLFTEAAPGLGALIVSGDFRACYALAYLRYSGRGGVAPDKTIAASLFKKAAEAGDLHAAYMIGVMYQRGDGVEREIPKATEWLLKAATAGDRRAQVALGVLYLKNAIGNNKAEAAKWLVMAAEAGDQEAQFLCGVIYENGFAGEKDMSRALQYYHRAALQGEKRAEKRLKDFADSMRKELGLEKPKEETAGTPPTSVGTPAQAPAASPPAQAK